MSSFEDYFFKIPISENSKSDWDDIIENSDDDLKLLRIFQARVCLLLTFLTSRNCGKQLRIIIIEWYFDFVHAEGVSQHSPVFVF